jgi:hypothetical protein
VPGPTPDNQKSSKCRDPPPTHSDRAKDVKQPGLGDVHPTNAAEEEAGHEAPNTDLCKKKPCRTTSMPDALITTNPRVSPGCAENSGMNEMMLYVVVDGTHTSPELCHSFY